MEIKRIFTDMDGTLLNSQGRVSETNAHMIRQSGLPLTLVSARAPMEMREALEALNLTGAQVGFNGALIYRLENGKVQPLHTQVIQKAVVGQVLKTVRQHFPEVSLSYYDLENWYCDRIDEGIRYEYQLTQQDPTFVTDQEKFLKGRTNTFKIMMICFEEETMQDLQGHLQGLGMEGITIQRSGQYYLEITHQAAKKSKGIAYILEKENLEKEATAAFGDGHNDIPMLEMVGYPIVMANAFDDVKVYAYKVTRSNDRDGVGYGIKKYLRA